MMRTHLHAITLVFFTLHRVDHELRARSIAKLGLHFGKNLVGLGLIPTRPVVQHHVVSHQVGVEHRVGRKRARRILCAVALLQKRDRIWVAL